MASSFLPLFSSPLLHSSLYVGSIYASKHPTDPFTGRPLSRDNAIVIKQRMKAVTLSTAASLSLVYASIPPIISSQPTVDKLKVFLNLTGLSLPSSSITGGALGFLRMVGLGLGLTGILFLGPLVVMGLERQLPGMSGWDWKYEWKWKFNSWWGRRNFMFGPLTEELVFRSAIIATCYLASHRFTKTSTIFVTPLYFGVAHLHHLYEVYVASGRTRDGLINGSVSSILQFTYTTLFGWYASYLFLRTSSIIPPLVSHTFANIMGFPAVVSELERHSDQKPLIITSYFLGIAGFTYGVWELAKPLNWILGVWDSVYWD